MVIILGESIHKISKAFVCIDSTIWEVASVCKALDTCFKSFFAVHALYPKESEHIWEAIQKSVYSIRTSYDKYTTSLDSAP